MSITQLDPPLPLKTVKGPGWAHFVIDYGPESDLMWVVFLDEGGACWTIRNQEIRMAGNWSLGRRRTADHGDTQEAAREAARPAATVAPIRPLG
jgi:hypothetical protein